MNRKVLVMLLMSTSGDDDVSIVYTVWPPDDLKRMNREVLGRAIWVIKRKLLVKSCRGGMGCSIVIF